MSTFYPKRKIKLPKNLEVIIQSIGFSLIFQSWIFISYLIDGVHNSLSLNLFSKSLIYIFIFYFYKLTETTTVVDKIEIDNTNKQIIILYWYFRLVKRTVSIKFEELNIKEGRPVGILMGGSENMKIYKNDKFCVKIIALDGWKVEQIKEIKEELMTIISSNVNGNGTESNS
ncbi:MAG: hypothetical protein WC142_03040 [Bacteroidales bacterium]|nr:hypothetical protein [Bacteroidales bacterium]MDD3330739.1 hypothetical protein [Bacteroidales bacterium]MDD4045108.1 hypothetical protein [Bacteroidales bacterium]